MTPRGTGCLLQPLPHLAMLHSGSMRCTRGSSMYSNCRLLSTWARSTLTETGTGPSPLDDGGETHTISFIDRLPGGQQEGCEEGHGQQGAPSGLKRGFLQASKCPLSCNTVYYGTRPSSVDISASFYLRSNSGLGRSELEKGIKRGAAAGLPGLWEDSTFLDFSRLRLLSWCLESRESVNKYSLNTHYAEKWTHSPCP